MLQKQRFGIILLLLMPFASFASEAPDSAPLTQRLKDTQREMRKILDDPNLPKTPAQARSVEEAKTIARAEAMLAEADTQIEKLTSESAELATQRDELKQMQTNLASGLIGAIFTAIMAVAGALLTAINSKPERDLKRLTVIEKAHQLGQSGIVIPDDISIKYTDRHHGSRSEGG